VAAAECPHDRLPAEVVAAWVAPPAELLTEALRVYAELDLFDTKSGSSSSSSSEFGSEFEWDD
jgi:hypothetical protein